MTVTETGIIWFCAAAAVTMVAVLLVRSAGRDPLGYVLAYFAFYGFGPAVNFALGNSIYTGIETSLIGKACWGLLAALLAVFLVGVFLPARPARQGPPRPADRDYPLATVLLVALAGYAGAVLALHGPAMLAGSKLERINLAGSWHYQYLLVEVIACSLFFIAWRSPAGRRAYCANAVCYVAYCVATNERDFLFVLFGVLLHVQLFGRRASPLRLGLIGVGSVLLATALASSVRRTTTIDPADALNEGSIIFVDTFVMSIYPAYTPYANGRTYLEALAHAVPLVPSPVDGRLMDWLVATYAPGSSSGYGFSLTAEAYLNFGLVGIPVVFAVLALVQRLLLRQASTGTFAAYFSVLFTVTWMYGFRGESATLLAPLIYGLLVFAGITAFSRPASPAAAPPLPVSRPDRRTPTAATR